MWFIGVVFLPFIINGSVEGVGLFNILLIFWLAGSAGLAAVLALTARAIDKDIKIFSPLAIYFSLVFGLIAHVLWSLTVGKTTPGLRTTIHFVAPFFVSLHLIYLNRAYLFGKN